MADWISVKLHEHGMASYHLAAKMRIASATVNAWKEDKIKPKVYRVREMVSILGKHSRLHETKTKNAHQLLTGRG